MQQHGILCWKYANYLEKIRLKTLAGVYGLRFKNYNILEVLHSVSKLNGIIHAA